MTTFVTIIYTLICSIMILVVLLQAGRGGGMGTALGGGASQSVFGGSGGADFMAKLTYGLASGFMVCAVYLAYASAHTGSSRLQAESAKLASESTLAAENADVNYERVGPNPLPLPPASAKGQTPPKNPAVPEPSIPADSAPAQGAGSDEAVEAGSPTPQGTDAPAAGVVAVPEKANAADDRDARSTDP